MLTFLLNLFNSYQNINRLAYAPCTRAEIVKPIRASSLASHFYPECTKDACSPTTVEIQPSVLTEFTRTFVWELKAPEKTAVGLNILGDGLKEMSPPCPDGFQYSAHTSKTNSKSRTQYCRGGSVTRFDLPNEAVVSLQVKPNAQIKSVFQASAGPLSKKE